MTTDSTITPKFVTAATAAVYLGIGLQTLRNWQSMGRGVPAHRFGTAIRYTIADLDEWAAGKRDAA